MVCGQTPLQLQLSLSLSLIIVGDALVQVRGESSSDQISISLPVQPGPPCDDQCYVGSDSVRHNALVITGLAGLVITDSELTFISLLVSVIPLSRFQINLNN